MAPNWIGFALLAAVISTCSSQYGEYKPRGTVEKTIIYAIGERPHPDEIYKTNEGRRDNKFHAHTTGYAKDGGYTSFSKTYYGKYRGHAKEYTPPQPRYTRNDHKTIILVGERESPKEIYYSNRGRSLSHGHGQSSYGGYGTASGYRSSNDYQPAPVYISVPTYQSGPSYTPKGHPQGRELYAVPQKPYNQYASRSYDAPQMPHCPKVDANFCSYQLMGHYAHPGEKQCYVQCDDHGKAYVRNCPYGTTWNRAPEQPYHMGFCG